MENPSKPIESSTSCNNVSSFLKFLGSFNQKIHFLWRTSVTWSQPHVTGQGSLWVPHWFKKSHPFWSSMFLEWFFMWSQNFLIVCFSTKNWLNCENHSSTETTTGTCVITLTHLREPVNTIDDATRTGNLAYTHPSIAPHQLSGAAENIPQHNVCGPFLQEIRAFLLRSLDWLFFFSTCPNTNDQGTSLLAEDHRDPPDKTSKGSRSVST